MLRRYGWTCLLSRHKITAAMNAPRPLRVLDELVLPLKLVVPQPVIAKIPFLRTNEDIRVEMALAYARGRVLDVGCGRNLLVERYRASGGDGVGVDVYPWPGVDEVVQDSSHLPFVDGSFDTVTFVACLNHIPNREAVLAEARRLLAPGGRVVLTNLTPRLSRIWHAWAFWDADQHERGMEEGEVWGFTDAELTEMLERNRFEISQRAAFSWGLNHLYVCSPRD
jgi:SAM-dependent methyltransferase